MTAVVQPAGTVTLVFTDIEGSTRLLEELGVDAYRDALAEHRAIVREACARFEGYEVDYEGDAFFYAFASASAAVNAVSDAMNALDAGPIRIRVGVHTGQPLLDPPKYVGIDVHRAARIMSCAHGGQVVVSPETVALLDPGLVSLSPLGSHRLKDIAEPLVLFQLGEGDFPPLRTLANTNLPTPASSFLGRETELAEADRLLLDTRLLTVTGPGGAGKTRFALELARRVRDARFSDYPDGVFGCFLSSLRDPTLLLPTIAYTLSVTEQGGLGALEALTAHLAGKRLLLLCDNVEHLLAAAPELSQLLVACPGLTVLCTSRELLRIDGETPYGLPPLAATEGVALFCERGRVEPSPAIAELCVRLEGLPLALELAAARLGLLTPEQLLERLSQRLDLLKGGRDADPRQQTLRATIQWSHDLLTPDEQRLFARLAVFAGGCTLEAAEQVADADLDTLQSLLDKNLIRRDDTPLGPRFWMLETIREYAVEQLDTISGAGEPRQQHAEFYLALAERAEPELKGPEQVVWANRLGAEAGNLREALGTLAQARTPDPLLRLCASLADLWLSRGPVGEAWSWFVRALDMDGADPAARAGALQWAPFFPLWQGDKALSRRVAEEAIEACSAVGDVRGVGRAMNALAGATPDLDAGRALLEASLPLFQQVGDSWGLAQALANLGDTLIQAGDYVAARAYLEQARAIGLERNDAGTVAGADSNLALISVLEGRDDDARRFLEGCARPLLENGETIGITNCLVVLALIAVRSGDALQGATLLGAVEEWGQQVGFSLDGVEKKLKSEAREMSMSLLGEDSFAQALAAGGAISLEQALATVLGET